MGNTVSRVDDSSSKCTVRDTIGGPRGGECKDSLDSDVQALDVERFEEDFCGLFSVLRRVERWFSLQGVVSLSG